MDMDLKKPLVGSVGRLAYQKGYDLLSEIVLSYSKDRNLCETSPQVTDLRERGEKAPVKPRLCASPF